MRLGTSGWILWTLYFAFVVYAVLTNTEDSTFVFTGELGGVKALVWVVWFVFLVFSINCNLRENFFRSVRSIIGLRWGQQISADLYIGLLLALLIIYLNEGAIALLIWLLPTLVFANLSILIYVALHFDGIVTKLLGL